MPKKGGGSWKRGRKGLSAVVTTLLVILLTIVAIVIMWAVMKSVVTKNSEFINAQKDFFSEKIEITYIKLNQSLVSISLRKTGGSLGTPGGQNVTETLEIAEADIISVVDLSGSMAPACSGVSSTCCRNTLEGSYSSSTHICSNVNPIRNVTCTTTCGGIWVDKLSSLKEANKELTKILSEAEGSRIGLVGYNTHIIDSASLDLTDNLNQLDDKIDSWQTGGSTCICCGINEALRRLQEDSSEDKMKKIVLMSDGAANIMCSEQNTQNAMQDAIKASCDAKAADSENLVIYTIGLGEDVNENTLISMADCGGGRYFSAMNVSELIEVYKRVAGEIRNNLHSPSKFTYLYIIFYNETTSYKEKITEIPDVLVIKNYNFDLTGKLEGEIKKIEVYPVIVSGSGKEVIGPFFDSWEAEE